MFAPVVEVRDGEDTGDPRIVRDGSVGERDRERAVGMYPFLSSWAAYR